MLAFEDVHLPESPPPSDSAPEPACPIAVPDSPECPASPVCPISVESEPQLRVATTTAQLYLSQRVCLRTLALYFPGSIVFDPRSTAFVNAQGARKKSFNNQATLELPIGNGRRGTASVFSNGYVKLTGLRSEEECHDFAQVLVQKISVTVGYGFEGEPLYAVEDPSNLSYSSLEIIMLKSDFDLLFPLNLQRVTQALRGSFPGTSYEPETYCAVKVPVPLLGRKPVTVCIFHTGKAFVSGRITLAEVRTVFDTVTAKIMASFKDVLGSAPVSASKKRRSPEAVAPVAPPAARGVKPRSARTSMNNTVLDLAQIA
eukprot:CAMPEP_0114564238 /NCGR_PEP_ID=MMETSP0114-20121206/13597_1 /TAXON_ID=31324 /ORGANISM="Goniomonas sp, Strain m" /LENGTH=314 /DNA_ID=CAMNT_0001750259 /DNA_START=42 /DNA_END=986 /DNA_ORIENTATION=-